MRESEHQGQLLQRGVSACQQGRFDEAEELFRRVLIQNNGNHDAHHLLGVIAMEQKRRDIALEHLRRAVQLCPDGETFHNSLGVFYMRDRRIAQGVHHFWQALAIDPNYLDGLKNLIVALRDVGDFDEVLRLADRALTLDPECVDARFNRSRALQLLERLDEAADGFRQALELDPDHVPSLTELGCVCRDQEELDAAEELLTRAIDLEPRCVRALDGLGHVYGQRGEDERAVETWQLALEVEPRAPAVLTSLGITLVQVGRADDGRSFLQRAIEAVPRHAEAHLALAQAGKVQADDPEIVRLESLVDADSIPDEDRAKLHFSLGKCYEDTGRYEQAFEQYRSGNELKRNLIDFDAGRVRTHVSSLIEYFSAERICEFAERVGSPSELPVFVVGMPRSGTTLVEQILASHPDVHGAGELPHVEQLVTRMPAMASPRAAWPHCLDRIDDEELQRLASEHVDRLRELNPHAQRVVDKMPKNAFHLGLIRMLFPQARIVHCRRDPLDICMSCYTRYFAKGQPFSWHLTELGEYYREYDRLSRYWNDVVPGPMLELAYEDVTSNQEDTTRRLIDFLGLPWDNACLDFHQSSRRVRTNPVQVRQPIYRSSVARWKRFEPWIAELQAGLSH